jgi:hypothetical protein
VELKWFCYPEGLHSSVLPSRDGRGTTDATSATRLLDRRLQYGTFAKLCKANFQTDPLPLFRYDCAGSYRSDISPWLRSIPPEDHGQPTSPFLNRNARIDGAVDEMIGFVKGVIADDEVTTPEIERLGEWLLLNKEVLGFWQSAFCFTGSTGFSKTDGRRRRTRGPSQSDLRSTSHYATRHFHEARNQVAVDQTCPGSDLRSECIGPAIGRLALFPLFEAAGVGEGQRCR